MTATVSSLIGPILFLDNATAGQWGLAALFVEPGDVRPPPIEIDGRVIHADRLATYGAATVWRARFAVPDDRTSVYRWNGEAFDIAADVTGDLRFAYVSCNGEEIGDLDREGSERNAMWSRLRDHHRRAPFALMLHGGDQVYADEVTQGHPLSEDWPEQVPQTPATEALQQLRQHLRERFLERYGALYASPEFAWLAARVPSLMQWDDHDICDGWGSLPTDRTTSAVGQMLFAVARESFLVFQAAATDGDLPHRFADATGQHLGWAVATRGARILAPDLRSERTMHRVMGPGGWDMMDREAARDTAGQTLLLSSVPLLGPRLSVLESLMVAIPRMQKYEDDLRDQWQSRAHRDEWRRMLRLVRDMARRDGHDVTAISGEIHLATRAEMDLGDGLHLQQLVASGIAHRPPPKAWARLLGTLASFGEDPLPEHPIRIERLPGQRGRYVAERNFLIVARTDSQWHAQWDLEISGLTEPLAL